MKQKNLKQREATLEEVVNRLAYFTSEFNMPHLFHEGKGRIIKFLSGFMYLYERLDAHMKQ